MSNDPKTLDELLDEVSYEYLNSPEYIPSAFALRFMNFIKLVEADNKDFNITPPVHLAMLDKLAEPTRKVINLLHRGAAKTTIFGEMLILYLAVFGGELPHMKRIWLMLYVSDTMENGAKRLKQNVQHRYDNSDFLKEWIPYAKFTEGELVFKNKDGKDFGVVLFGAQSGVRGVKMFGRRPTLAVLDDLMSDKVAGSPAALENISKAVYNGVMPAMEKGQDKIIFNGTPFNKEDIIVSAVESGAWDVNVYPVAEKFPCEPNEFRGSWEDRFSYDTLMEDYEFFKAQDKLHVFYQEMMLRITNEEDRLVRETEINWYDSKMVHRYRSNFNFYITTDFATSAKQSADYSVISVWAHNAQGDWFWVDGCAERVTMDKNINRLFTYVQMYQPMSVGVEINGQQAGFIAWLKQEMFQRNIWFNLARTKSGEGIRRTADKMTNFSFVVPLFKQGKMYFPEDKEDDEVMKVFKSQIGLAMKTGFKGKDDFLDTISMLPYMEAIRPSPEMRKVRNELGIWESAEPELDSIIDSYVV